MKVRRTANKTCVCDFSFCRRSLATRNTFSIAETSKIIANSCCAAVRLCSAAAAKRSVMLPLDERPPGELRIARALPLSDPYDALATWKSAKRTHQERLKSELDDTFRKKGKLVCGNFFVSRVAAHFFGGRLVRCSSLSNGKKSRPYAEKLIVSSNKSCLTQN